MNALTLTGDAKILCDKIYHSMSKALNTATTNPTREEVTSSVLRQAQKVITELPRTPGVDIDPKSIEASQKQDGSIDITYALTLPKQKPKSLAQAEVTFTSPNQTILKYLSRCETCRTATGKLKLRWFWKSGVVTDMTTTADPTAIEEEAEVVSDKAAWLAAAAAAEAATKKDMGGRVTVVTDYDGPLFRHGMPCQEHSFNNSFAFVPMLLPSKDQVSWNPIQTSVFDSELGQMLSQENKLVLEELDKAANKIIGRASRKHCKCNKHGKHRECSCSDKHSKPKTASQSLAMLRKQLVAEHLDDAYFEDSAAATTTVTAAKHMSKSKRRALRTARLQERVTAAVEYSDAFTESVDTEAGIRYRLERVQRQLDAEVHRRVQAGEIDLPRSSARYYKAVIDELNRQIEQCERFNIWAEAVHVG